jgi:uncharacterized protein
MCHQVIEKSLKAATWAKMKSEPEYIHSLSRLFVKSGIEADIPENLKNLIDLLEPMNIETRYPTHKEKILASLTRKRCKGVVPMDKKTVIERVHHFSETLRDEYDPVMVILYGSYAKETQNESSDIDVAVIVEKINGDFLDQEARLYCIRRQIDDRIEPVLLDIHDDQSGFLESIIKNGEIIYKRENHAQNNTSKYLPR